MKKLFYFFLGIFLIGSLEVACSSNASANYAVNGQCFTTASDALDSFVAGYPRLDTTTASPSWYSISSASISGQVLTVVIRQNSTDQLSIDLPISDCSSPTQQVFSIETAWLIFTFFFTVILTFFGVGYGGGRVLAAIRKAEK